MELKSDQCGESHDSTSTESDRILLCLMKRRSARQLIDEEARRDTCWWRPCEVTSDLQQWYDWRNSSIVDETIEHKLNSYDLTRCTCVISSNKTAYIGIWTSEQTNKQDSRGGPGYRAHETVCFEADILDLNRIFPFTLEDFCLLHVLLYFTSYNF